MAKTLTKNGKISEMAHREVVGALREILSDPDFGMLLRPEAIKRLKKSVRSKQAGKVKALKDVLAKY
ncbi:hypothetical protein MYX06_00460 [Patescibacteria group bacterium AH-259-L05]|nr:hypothetical protein [Patescibacteria group bacterium AH-259-L05]